MDIYHITCGIQGILRAHHEPVPIPTLENIFEERFQERIEDVVGMSTGEYVRRKVNIFDYNQDSDTVSLQLSIRSGPPIADPNAVKDEVFVVKECESLVEAMGPVVYISALCGKFIQRNGVPVTSIVGTRPLDLFKRHPRVFLIVGNGNVTLKKFEHLPEVQRFLNNAPPKAQRNAKAAEEASPPLPEVVTELHVVNEFRHLILNDDTNSVYISSLCGRFLQRFKKSVTTIINCKPTEFLRRYPDIFVMTGGGNVGLREVLGPDVISVPCPLRPAPKVLGEEVVASPASKRARQGSKELNEAQSSDLERKYGVDAQNDLADENEDEVEEEEEEEEELIDITLRSLGGKVLCVAAVSPDAPCEALHGFAAEVLGQLPGIVKIIGKDGQIPAMTRISDNFSDGADVQVVFELDQHQAWEDLKGAAIDGDGAKVKSLLYAGAGVHAVDESKRTVLHEASREGHAAVVNLLLEKCADANVGDKRELAPLHFAAALGHQAVAMALLQHGAHRNARDYIRETPLAYAIMRGHRDVQELLRSAA